MSIQMEEALELPPVVAKRYQRIAKLYDRFTDYEMVQHRRAVSLIDMDPRSKVLDVACGTGRGLAALSQRLEPDVVRYGVDLTPAMLSQAKRKLQKLKLAEAADLRTGNAASLPFSEGEFDVVYSGYFFDLVKLEQMPVIIREMKRVLKPGGYLVLVNMSKNVAGRSRYEKWYTAGKLGIFSGSCRPVLMGDLVRDEGFKKLQRHYYANQSLFFLNKMFGTEILIAQK